MRWIVRNVPRALFSRIDFFAFGFERQGAFCSLPFLSLQQPGVFFLRCSADAAEPGRAAEDAVPCDLIGRAVPALRERRKKTSKQLHFLLYFSFSIGYNPREICLLQEDKT